MRMGAAYIRVSTDQQMELSPESQRGEIEKYAKANDIVLSEEFIFEEDEGRSGRKSANRPEFQRMIGMAKAQPKPFDVILVWKYSRFARNQEESIVYKSMLRSKCGIDIISVSEPLVDGPFGSLIERIIEWMDEYYSIRLSGEVVRGMTEKAQRGGVVGSPAFGYKVVNGTFVPVQEEAEIVRMVFEKFVNEQVAMRELATMLNTLGVRTKKGSQMENRTVEYMLHNPVYIGKIRWSRSGKIDRNYDKEDVVLVDGHHEPIISEELFNQAQEKLATRKKMYARHAHEASHKQEYMLRGLVRCSNCGSTLIYVPQNGGLQCHSYAKGSCKESHYISAAQANIRVVDLIEKCFQEQNFSLEHRNRAPAGNDQKLIEAQIQRERQKLARVKAAYEDGIDSLEEYKANKEKILRTIEKLNSKMEIGKQVDERSSLKEFIESHKDLVKDLRNPELTDDVKNVILRSCLDHVVFDRAKNRFQAFFYD